MPKSLVALLDGTWNTVESQTNIWKLGQLLAGDRADGGPQVVRYDPGVGTAFGLKLVGGLFGYGLEENAREAYAWIRDNWEDGDDVYLFGFSRGAFTARSLAGVIARCGLAKRDGTLTIDDAFGRYKRMREDRSIRRLQELHFDRERGQGPPFTAEDELFFAQSRRIPIRFVGVFDTVGALGVPFGDIPGVSRRSFAFHDTRLSTVVRSSRQAIAIDEQRAAYAPTRWKSFTPQPPPDRPRPAPDAEQRWFCGAHANVGGGYRGNELSDIPLAWLMREAATAGLAFSRPYEPRPDAFRADIRDSFREFAWGLYALARLWRRFDRVIQEPPFPVEGGILNPVNETIDGSVFDRWRADPAYRPRPITEWAARIGADPAAIRGPVAAATGVPLSP